MPELPEVERARKQFDAFVGLEIQAATVFEDKLVLVNCDGLESHLVSNSITKTDRRGKLIVLHLAKKPHLVIHLGMTGSLQVKGMDGFKHTDFKTGSKDDDFPPKYAKIVFVFENNEEIALTDPRRLARVRLINDPLLEPPISELGFDPVHGLIKLEDFEKTIKLKRVAIKSLLLDQSFCAGIGNWMADEVLFQAKVHPSQNTQTLTNQEIETIYDKIQYVVKTALEVNADMDLFPKHWIFHVRFKTLKLRWTKGKKRKQDHDRQVKFLTVGGRTSAINPSLQILHK